MAKQYYQGKYTPKHPDKYAGNIHDVVYRSGWELQMMMELDRNPSVILWNSEGLAIPYRSPLDGKIHRYFPDLLFKVRDRIGNEKTFLVEIKPHSQTQLRTPKRKTKHFLSEVATYAVNTAKWEAAKEFCKDQGWEFKIITEKHHSFI